MARRRKGPQWSKLLFALVLTGAYIIVLLLGIPFLARLTTSPPWGWAMLAVLMYFAFAALSLVTHLWGINLRRRILFIRF
jgi:hypothetical protein